MPSDFVVLSDLCDSVGVQVDPQDHSNAMYVGLEHVSSGRLVRTGAGVADDVQSAKFVFEPGDVLYGKLRPYLDKAVVADLHGICTTELLVLRPKKNVDAKFLVAVLHSARFIEHAVAGTTGVQHPRTSWQHIAKFPVPRYDLADQIRIATALWRIHDAIEANGAAVQCGQDLKQVAMQSLFTRGLQADAQKETEIGLIPETWEICECEDLAEEITVGVVVKPASYYVPNGVPAFRSLNVKNDRIDARSLVFFSSEDNDTLLAKSKLRSGDVLVVRTGYPGTSCVVPREFDGANCIDLVIVRPKVGKVIGSFLSRFLNSDGGRAQAFANSYGLAQKHLNVGAVRRLKVPVPPSLEEQAEIVEVLGALDQKIDLHERKQAVLKELFRSLLHCLLNGEIRVEDLDISGLSVDFPEPDEAVA
jgi:type I restriction enzyme S subunit